MGEATSSNPLDEVSRIFEEKLWGWREEGHEVSRLLGELMGKNTSDS
jgi:hypothetical protein